MNSDDEQRHADLQAERAILASVLLDPDALGLLEDLDPGVFYSPGNAVVFRTMLRIARNGQPVDLVTLRGALAHMGDLQRAGGDEALLALTEHVPISTNVEGYAATVKDHASVRRLFASCGRTLARKGTAIEDVPEFLDARTRELVEIATEAHSDGSVEHVADVLPQVRGQLHERQERGGVAGLSTGFGSLDRLLAGLTPGQLVILAGRPGMGKSALAQAIVLHNVLESRPAMIFSLEMSSAEWTQRMAMAHASIDSNKARRGLLSESEWSRFTMTENRLRRVPLFIDATPGLTPEALRAKARRTHARHGLRLLVVDYLQLMRGGAPGDSPEQVVGEASRSLKELAKELGIPVIACAQLNREVERRGGDKRPIIADLRQSGQIEQDADVIAFLYREFVYHPKKADPRHAEIIVRKQRMGPTGTVRAQFIAEFTRFEDYDPHEAADGQKKLGGGRGL